MILVIGATGFLGSEICRLLAGDGRTVRALVRTTSAPEKIDALRQRGIEIAVGDLKDADSLDAACDGVETVISTASSTFSRADGDSIETVDRAGQLALVESAQRRGVRRFIYVSFSGNIDLDSPLRNAKREVEQAIRSSGMQYTILRPSYFMEAWLSPALGFDPAGGRARVYGSGSNRLSYISLADVARFAAAAVDSTSAQNRVIELGGPEAVSQLDAVRLFGEAFERPIEVERVPEEAIRAQYEGEADAMGRTFAALMLGYAAGDEIEMRGTLDEFPVELTSVRDHARRMASTATRGAAGAGAG